VNLKLIFIFIFSVSFYFSQNEMSKWYFGNSAALDFLASPVSTISNSNMNTVEGSTSIADVAGNLLFYTNGYEVWDKNNNILSNGQNLSGHPSTTQSAFVVKKPGSNNLYYIFTQGVVNSQGALAYSIIDMSLSSGTGSVIIKNDTIELQMTEKLTGTLHCNGKDFWILAHKSNTNEFYAYLLTSAGLNTTPVISAVGSVHGPGNSSNIAPFQGYLKISPTGKKIGLAFGAQNGVLELADFNPASGVVTNALTLGAYTSVYGCEFSPDGTKFYGAYLTVSTPPIPDSHLLQWDLCSGSNSAIIASQTSIATASSVNISAMQLGLNGKIYLAMASKQYIGIINNPNVSGTACNFVQNGISLGSAFCSSGLPNLPGSFFKDRGVLGYSVSCNSTNFDFMAPNYCLGVTQLLSSVSWSFGDPSAGSANTSTLTNPSHTYSANGSYTVKLILNYDCSSDTLKQIININVPNISTNGKTIICSKEKTILTASGANTYTWSTGLNTASISLTPSLTTVYTVVGTNSTNLCTGTKVVTVTVNPCTSIFEDSESVSLIKIYPNPNKGEFKIETSQKHTQITIYDHLGKQVYSALVNETKQIDLKELAAGIYFVKAEHDGKVNYTKLILSN
jgi:hypothetical protein